MPRLYNIDRAPVVVANNRPAVYPGQAHDFTDEQVAAGLTGAWSTKDPREGLEQERAFKARRRAEVTENPTPAAPDKETK